MKSNLFLTVAALLAAISVPAMADVSITPGATPATLATMPGSPDDYTFFGNAAEFPDAPGFNDYTGTHSSSQPTVLDDFTAARGANAAGQYTGDTGYSLINGPAGSGESSVATGDLFGPVGGDAPDLVEFTLNTSDPTYNFSDFDVFVMFGNGPGDMNDHINDIDFSVLSPSRVPLATITPIAMTDSNSSTGQAYFEEFEVKGAAAGDILEIGTSATSPKSDYLGGVSFADLPEPATWALMGAGIVFLVFRVWRKSGQHNA